MTKTANQIFRAEYGTGKNFMTPDVLERELLDGGAYELSQGRGIEGERIWGVTVIHVLPDGSTKRSGTDLSKMFHSRSKARQYINDLVSEGVALNA